MLLDIILFVFFAYSNSKIARRKGLSPALWVFMTIVTMITAMFVGAFIVMLTYRGAIQVASVQRFLMNNPLKILTFYACEAGGGLLIRYVLERRPDADGGA
jgi:hypothetical protein